jgi:hypothetical protein
LIEFYEYEKKCGKNHFKGPKMAAKDDATILFAATILTAPTVFAAEPLDMDKPICWFLAAETGFCDLKDEEPSFHFRDLLTYNLKILTPGPFNIHRLVGITFGPS